MILECCGVTFTDGRHFNSHRKESHDGTGLYRPRHETLDDGVRTALDILTGWTGQKYNDTEKVKYAIETLNAALEHGGTQLADKN